MLTHDLLAGSARERLDAAIAASALPEALDVGAILDIERYSTNVLLQVADTSGLGADGLAYVMYTSGSTGKPKGVMVEHRSVVNLLCSMRDTLRIDLNDRVLGLATVAFDMAVPEIYLPLISGALLVITPRSARTDPAQLIELMERSDITFMQATPSTWRMLIDAGWRGAPRLRALCGAEALPIGLSHEIGSRVAELWNFYGPTETTVWSTAMRVTAGRSDQATTYELVGRPIANTQVYVLDTRGRPAPIGVAGEIYIGGAGVARGYLNRPELTAQRFIVNPFEAGGGERIYKTGDVGRCLPDGCVEYLGRNDDQVKIRGFRIELGEIEACLLQHADIRAAVVLAAPAHPALAAFAHPCAAAREDDPGDKRLVCYVTSQRTVAAEELRAHLARSLPEYMLPAAYVQLPEIPLTPNGKVHRQSLPAPERRAYITRAHEAPVGALEQVLADAWVNVLDIEQVGRHDSLFDLGGHSISLLKIVSRLGDAGIKVSVATVFAHPTVASLAAELSQSVQDQAPEGAILIRKGERSPLFLVHDVHGDELYFPVLAAHLDRAMTVYGLPGTPLVARPPRTMEELAARLVGIVRAAQPYGPYRLAGWSFGGSLAYEIATQLVQQRQTVEFLGLLDTHNAGSIAATRDFSAQSELLGLCWQESGLTESQRQALSALHAQTRAIGFDELLEQCKSLGALPEYLAIRSDAHVLAFCTRAAAHSHASAHYRPQPLPMPVHLFMAEQQPSPTADYLQPEQLLGWRHVCSRGGLRVIAVPGNHISLMNAPNVAVLGQAISQAIFSI